MLPQQSRELMDASHPVDKALSSSSSPSTSPLTGSKRRTASLVMILMAAVLALTYTVKNGLKASSSSATWIGESSKTKNNEKNLLMNQEQAGADAEVITLLSQSDFAMGTVRLTSPGYYLLTEDIVFEPNPNHGVKNGPGAYLPDFQTQDYPRGPYSLGFFTAVTIEVPGVTFDLNGKTIRQSKAFYLQQRFYAHVTLASTPFVIGEGPSNWGDKMNVSTDCVVKNGYLGLSSHHGIQGNNATGCLLENLHITDFEVAGISINTAKQVTIRDVIVEKSATHLPVAGTYGNARYMLMFMRMIPLSVRQQTMITFNGRGTVTLENVLQSLETGMNLVFDRFVLGDESAVNKPGYSTEWDNPTGLPDGTAAYGILINGFGQAVNGIGASPPSSRHVLIENVVVRELSHSMREIVAIKGQGADQGIASGATGNQLNILAVSSGLPLESATYQGSLLSDAIIAMQLKAPRYVRARMKTLNISDFISSWATTGTPLSNYEFVCNGDSQFHVGKGLFGIRIDGTEDFELRNVVVENVASLGGYGSPLCGSYEQSHPNMAQTVGYGGTPAYGVSITRANGIVSDLKVSSVVSSKGVSYGIVVWNEAHVAFEGETTVTSVVTMGGTPPNPDLAISLPNLMPTACAVDIEYSENVLTGEDTVNGQCVIGLQLCHSSGTEFGSGDPSVCSATGQGATIRGKRRQRPRPRGRGRPRPRPRGGRIRHRPRIHGMPRRGRGCGKRCE